MRREWLYMGLLAALAAVLFSLNLGGYGLWPPDEPRFAQVAREMLQSGNYLTPHINGEPYKEKPPLLFWCVAMLSRIPGDVTEVTARIPSVVSGVLTLLVTMALAQRLYGPQVALWSGVILITSFRYWWQARFGQIDMLLALWLSLSLYSFWRWHEARRLPWLLGFYLAVAAGVMSKGPGVVVFPGLLVLTFYWHDWAAWRAMRPVLGAVIVVGLYALWMLPARMGVDTTTADTGAQSAVAANLFRQTLGRFGGVSHANPPWYYLLNLPVDWLPWALFLPWSIPWVWRNRREGGAMRLLLCWSVPAFLFFSAAIGKRQLYLFPLAPVLAILFARSILDLMQSESSRLRRGIAMVWAMLLLAGAGTLCALPLTPWRDSGSPALWICAGVFTVFAGFALADAWRNEARRIHQGMAMQMAGVSALAAIILFPLIDPHTSAKDFCAIPRQWSEAKTDYDLYSVGFSREEYIYYSKHFHTPVLTEMIPMEDGKHDLMAIGMAQKKLMRALSKATGKVPVANFSDVRPEELGALHDAMQQAVDESGVDAALRAQFEIALGKELDAFFARFEGQRPALLFVQEDDWRWILALHPTGRELTMLKRQPVGSREVLLMANRAGAAIASAL